MTSQQRTATSQHTIPNDVSLTSVKASCRSSAKWTNKDSLLELSVDSETSKLFDSVKSEDSSSHTVSAVNSVRDSVTSLQPVLGTQRFQRLLQNLRDIDLESTSTRPQRHLRLRTSDPRLHQCWAGESHDAVEPRSRSRSRDGTRTDSGKDTEVDNEAVVVENGLCGSDWWWSRSNAFSLHTDGGGDDVEQTTDVRRQVTDSNEQQTDYCGLASGSQDVDPHQSVQQQQQPLHCDG